MDERPQGLERLGVVAAEHPELAREPLATLGEFGLAGLLPARVEARLEQFHQQPGQQRVAREGFLDVALRERHADLQEELAVTAQHRSEEHTSELQSLMRISYAVFCLTKKKF